ncbi:hypothetical protein RND81_04G016400 [Saponaria officinalis]|uniref:Retrotransposon gag domain-containing protein n=1 Tax=Saponaria officinalis TaxID=3572 RepID=A0AAW1LC94_SAPOF
MSRNRRIFDPEIEATARRHNAERRRRAQQPPLDSTTPESEPERETKLEIESEAESEPEPPIMSSIPEDSAPKAMVSSSIVKPTIGANNFELKTSLIHLITQFMSLWITTPYYDPVSQRLYVWSNEGHYAHFGIKTNPNEHLNFFLEKSDMIKINGVSEDEWLRKCAADSFNTWEKLSKAFLQKFFPPGKTAKLRNDIAVFVQHEDESLYEAWERFKELHRQCPHHGIPSYLLVVTFYNAVKPELQMILNAASGGRLDSMTRSRAKDLIEGMAVSTYHWGPSRSVRGSKTGSGLVHMMQTQIDELTQQISQLKASSSSSSAQVCNLCGIQGHDSGDCVSMPMSEQVNALGTKTFDPYSNTYNPEWAHNPRLSYANNNNTQQPPIQTQPNQPPPAQPKSSLDLMMEQFVQVQGKKNDELTQSITNISNSVAGVTNSVSQLTSSQKMSKAVSITDEIVEIVDETPDEPKKDAEEATPKETVDIPTTPKRVYIPPVPFPQHLAKLSVGAKIYSPLARVGWR